MMAFSNMTMALPLPSLELPPPLGLQPKHLADGDGPVALRSLCFLLGDEYNFDLVLLRSELVPLPLKNSSMLKSMLSSMN